MACEGRNRPHSRFDFDSLDLAGSGLLAFQGPTAAVGAPGCAGDSHEVRASRTWHVGRVTRLSQRQGQDGLPQRDDVSRRCCGRVRSMRHSCCWAVVLVGRDQAAVAERHTRQPGRLPHAPAARRDGASFADQRVGRPLRWRRGAATGRERSPGGIGCRPIASSPAFPQPPATPRSRAGRSSPSAHRANVARFTATS